MKIKYIQLVEVINMQEREFVSWKSLFKYIFCNGWEDAFDIAQDKNLDFPKSYHAIVKDYVIDLEIVKKANNLENVYSPYISLIKVNDKDEFVEEKILWTDDNKNVKETIVSKEFLETNHMFKIRRFVVINCISKPFILRDYFNNSPQKKILTTDIEMIDTYFDTFEDEVNLLKKEFLEKYSKNTNVRLLLMI